MARRDTSGAAMSLKDTGMWACTLREPRHLATELQIGSFDETKMKEGRERVLLPMFGNGQPGGIFSGKG